MSHFKEILITLGASKTELLKDSTNWSLWKAEFSTPVSTVAGYYLYLKSRCPLKEATGSNPSVWKSLCGGEAYEVIVTPKSQLSQDLDNTCKVFKGSNATTSKQLLWNNFLGDIEFKPISTEEYFVEPSLELSNGEVVSGSLKFLKDWLTNNSPSSDIGLAVLSADGGVGKTTISRQLSSNIQKTDSSVIPILIESDQWKHLVESSITLDSLWDLAISKRFEQASRLLSNETALHALVQEGLFVIIFDGFDELCAAGHSPKEIVEKLHDMVEVDDGLYSARILITARETFWSSVCDEVEVGVDVFKLKGFDNQQKKEFFKNRLKNHEERDLAFRMAKEISGAIYGSIEREELNEDRPSGIPFVLSLIAHYVEGNPEATAEIYKGDPLERLLEDICRRENKRQTLGIEPENQIIVFEELFREYQNEFTSEDLKTYLEVLCDVSSEDVVTRFTNHAFIEQVGKNRYAPRYEVLRVYFIARYLAQGLRKVGVAGQGQEIAKILAEQSTGKTQVLDWLLIQLRKLKEEYLLEAIHHARVIIEGSDNVETRKEAFKALFYIAMNFVTKQEKKERTKQLNTYMSRNRDDPNFNNVVFPGLLKSFDFSNSTFSKCTFVDLEFKNCLFSKNTLFSGCSFEGQLNIGWCKGEADIQFENCRYSKEAEFRWGSIQKKSISEKTRLKFAEEVLERALRKFKGTSGYRGIQARHSNAGFKKGNPYNDEIWKVLKKAISGIRNA